MNPETSIELLERYKLGDREALDRLLRRYREPLCRFAHGRLPHWARDMCDTQDLVQDAIIQVLRRLSEFQPTGPGALQSYLRAAVMNRLRDELRRFKRRPPVVEIHDDIRGRGESPLHAAIGRETLDRYETALSELDEEERGALIARLEWGFDYRQIAEEFGKPSPDAARVAVRRTALKLAKAMQRMGVDRDRT